MSFDTPAFPWRQLPSNLDPFDWAQLQSWLETKYDRRTAEWPLMQSIVPTLIISAGYIAFVVIGNHVMKRFQPLPTKTAMIVYNAFVLLLNLWLFIGLVTEHRKLDYGFICNRVDYGVRGERMAWLIYVYYLSKALDFTDTVFMVVRKKADQASLLHVYHHVMMFPIWWTCVRWCAGGDGIFGPILNTFIHFIMYTYYLATCFGIRIPGKHLLTQLQMFQLFSILVYSIFVIAMDCEYPHWTQYAQVVFLVTLLYLFYDFYRKSYLQKRKDKKQLAASSASIKSH
jgi:elongation of very long chain fatty acids protein 4